MPEEQPKFFPAPPNDPYPEVLAEVAAAIADGDSGAARTALATISFTVHDVKRPPTIPPETVGEVYMRDRFRCRYCGAKTIPIPVLTLIHMLYPELLPVTPGWKVGHTHPAFFSRGATVDHVEPIAVGGGSSVENLVTACWPCNSCKRNWPLSRLRWKLREIPLNDEWDGLTRYYRAIWEEAGRPDERFHLARIRAFGSG